MAKEFFSKFRIYLSVVAVLSLLINPFSSLALAEEIQQLPPAPAATTEEVAKPETPAVQEPAPAPVEEKQPAAIGQTPAAVEPQAADTKPEVVSNENSTKSEETKNDEDKKVTETNDTSVANDNNAEVENNVNEEANTGDNKANNNDGDAAVNSGDAKIALSILNLINSNLISLGGGEVKFIVKNVDGNKSGDYVIDPKTGNISSLDNGPVIIGNIKNYLDIKNNNTGTLMNNVDLYGNSGNNSANNNTGDSAINTGDVNLSLNLINFLNSTFVVGEFGVINVLNIFGNYNGNLVIPKEVAGGNNVSLDGKNKITISNNNQGNVLNQINSGGNTGNNVANANVGDTSILTGAIDQLVNLKNYLNQNYIGDVIYLAFVNVLGKWNGKDMAAPFFALFSNSKDSQNATEANVKNNQKIENNNNSVLANFVNIFGNTGGNRANANDGSVSIQTGNVGILANILNFSNVNIMARRFVFLVVNIFGDWNGGITTAQSTPTVPTQIFRVAEVKKTETVKKIKDNFFQPILAAAIPKTDNTALNQPASSNNNQESPENILNKIEEPTTEVFSAFLYDHFNQIVFFAFFLYILVLVGYFAKRGTGINR